MLSAKNRRWLWRPAATQASHLRASKNVARNEAQTSGQSHLLQENKTYPCSPVDCATKSPGSGTRYQTGGISNSLEVTEQANWLLFLHGLHEGDAAGCTTFAHLMRDARFTLALLARAVACSTQFLADERDAEGDWAWSALRMGAASYRKQSKQRTTCPTWLYAGGNALAANERALVPHRAFACRRWRSRRMAMTCALTGTLGADGSADVASIDFCTLVIFVAIDALLGHAMPRARNSGQAWRDRSRLPL